MDFFVWSILESKVPANKRSTIPDLKESLQKAWDQITTEELAGIVSNFKKRLNFCISAKGGHFENLN